MHLGTDMSAKKYEKTSTDQSTLDSNYLAEGIQFQMGSLNSLSSSTSQYGECYFFAQKFYVQKELITGIVQNNMAKLSDNLSLHSFFSKTAC